MRLLYAEDEPALSEAVVDYLTYHKYIVDAVYDGEEAYDYAISSEYDGIILDIMMPKKDGLEVLSALRRNGCKTPTGWNGKAKAEYPSYDSIRFTAEFKN